ncbi:MAG: hypothetical protein RMK73_06060 [Geminicoccaceae bacterium]|nr:hypothetical protein [Geminicoccaceae bacterium]MDW8125217.1 hypothetical protein [Geminicoccaceae bacterium]MDW8341029.1 hypothetical protein [Geminicoccaceae bacterium]
MAESSTDRFLELKRRALVARARRLVRLTPEAVGLRPQDLRYAPSPAHFAAAQRRLSAIDRSIRARLARLDRLVRGPEPRPREDVLLAMAMVEREIDRARRAFGMFFEIFAQRGTAFAPSLAAHDAIAVDCYRAVRAGLPGEFAGPILAPLTYLEHGYSPATMRRGVSLARLLGEPNPFPLIRIPYDRDQPWQAVFLHEVAHNLMADLRVWQETREAVIVRLHEARLPLRVVAIYGRWHKEIFADLAALLLGGPAVAYGMAEFLAHPSDQVMTYRPGGPHPVGYLRVLLLAEMLRRMEFAHEAEDLASIWRTLYDPRRGHRIPPELLATRARAIPAVVDEIAFQPRRNLAQRALASVIRFTAEDQRAIRRAAFDLAAGMPATDVPPRHLPAACRYALNAGADSRRLGFLVTELLAASGTGWPAERLAPARSPPPRTATPRSEPLALAA